MNTWPETVSKTILCSTLSCAVSCMCIQLVQLVCCKFVDYEVKHLGCRVQGVGSTPCIGNTLAITTTIA